MSSTSTRLFFSESGTSPATMRCARPSTIAVLPTPGSPISTGLFLVRRCSTWIARRISSSRPITGSSLPCRARSVRSSVYFFSASRWPSASALSTFWPPRTASIAASSALRVRPCSLQRAGRSPTSTSAAASRNISLAMNWSPRLLASFSAACSSAPSSRPGWHLLAALHLRQALAIAASSAACSLPTLTPARASSAFGPSACASIAASTWTGSMYGLSRVTARLWASASASWNLVVSLSIRMAGFLRIAQEIGRRRAFSRRPAAPRLDSDASSDRPGRRPKAERRAGERADDMGERVAEREQPAGRAAAGSATRPRTPRTS